MSDFIFKDAPDVLILKALFSGIIKNIDICRVLGTQHRIRICIGFGILLLHMIFLYGRKTHSVSNCMYCIGIIIFTAHIFE